MCSVNLGNKFKEHVCVTKYILKYIRIVPARLLGNLDTKYSAEETRFHRDLVGPHHQCYE